MNLENGEHLNTGKEQTMLEQLFVTDNLNKHSA